MVNRTSIIWTIEPIPNEDALFRRVHVNILISSQDFTIPPIIFQDNNGISMDWEKYSTAIDAQNRAKEPNKMESSKSKQDISEIFNIFLLIMLLPMIIELIRM
jgi:hypothetical protein